MKKVPTAKQHSYNLHLLRHEYFWVDQQPFLLSCGYKLRSRYDPAWIPSWTQPGMKEDNYAFCEDGHCLWKENVIDATRTKDGIKVVLKCVRLESDEFRIALYLSSSKLLSDPRNRTVPIRDVISLPDDKEFVLLVMPYLRVFHTPPFHCCAEFVEAFRQFLQGLEFMHEQNISHGDACLFNLMMDESRVVPKGSHFIDRDSHDGVHFNLRWRRRCSVAPVRYFYIDFGLSTWHPNGPENATILRLAGQIKDIPELSDTVPYNPFKVDVCQLGRTILRVIKDYPDLQIFDPLAQKMAHPDPDERPSVTEALAEFEAVVSSISRRRLRKRIWRHEDTLSKRIFHLIYRGSLTQSS